MLQETLRCRPPVSFVMRHVQVPLEVRGHAVEPGWTVAAALDVIHQRADLFDDPGAFRPERFADGPGRGLAWLPFGGGRRRCLGAAFAQVEIREVLGEVLRRVDLAAASARPERWRRQRDHVRPHRGAASS